MAEVIDYIVEQADRDDAKNLQYEEDIKFRINKLIDKMIVQSVECGICNIGSQLRLEHTIERLQKVMVKFISDVKLVLADVAKDYSDMAYSQTNNLIAIGYEVSGKMKEKVTEQKVVYDEDTIEYIQKYAFDLLTGYGQQKINELRSKLGYLLLTGDGSKAKVRELIEKTLNVNRSKAEEIAQQELSMAYNAGTLRQLRKFAEVSNEEVFKYWHGFKYSERTCEYCRERIGNVYDLDDDSETLPAHVRCRCVWLPILKSWNKPVTNRLMAKANMLNVGYSPEMIYQRINDRLGINYADYINEDAAYDYVAGERSTKMSKEFETARNNWISDTIKSWDIQPDTTGSKMSSEYNQQIKFWKNIVASAMADNDMEILDGTTEAIKGIMTLPWTAYQMNGWQTLLSKIQ